MNTETLREKLLEPGWAGELSEDDLKYIKSEIHKDRKLRTAWGFCHGNGRVNDTKIRLVAMYGREAIWPKGNPNERTAL